MEILKQIQSWYAAQCDGDWEHQYGVSIDTLDNPGWNVIIDLSDTNLENITFNAYQDDKSDEDWIFCEVTAKKFIGRGDPNKLQSILQIFVDLIERK